jgi:DNA helicase II / ATP-dependent DNA helicase PcrA
MLDFDQRYNNLNQFQKLAVDEIYGPVLVLAGPGSGKTELMSIRIANILKLTDTLPQSILCLTFTDSAVKNLRERLLGLIGAVAYKINIFTFHSLGSEIINQYPEYFFDGVEYLPSDEINQIRIIEKVLNKLSLNNPLAKFSKIHGWVYMRSILGKINILKQEGINPNDFLKYVNNLTQTITAINPLFVGFAKIRSNKVKDADLQEIIVEISKTNIQDTYTQILLTELDRILKITDPKVRSKSITLFKTEWAKKIDRKTQLKEVDDLPKLMALGEIYAEYQLELHQQALFDFGDMLIRVKEELVNNCDLQEELREKYQFVLVDEFQDTSGLQLKFLFQFLNFDSDNDPNVMVVGDDDQSIYKFQGANNQNFLLFEKEFQQTKIIHLNKNYRSAKDILDFAKDIIDQSENNVSKSLGLSKIMEATR